MDFKLTQEQQAIRDAVSNVCSRFPDDYWLKLDVAGDFPHDFYNALAIEGWLGSCTPEVFGGSGLGITEAAIMMRAVAESGGGMSAASSVHINIFGLNPVTVFGSEPQKRRMLPPVAAGKEKLCFAVSEPNTGLNTTQLKLAARKVEDRYVVNGQKVWISTAQEADNILLLARTTPPELVEKRSRGLSLFYTRIDRQKIRLKEIPKMGRHAVDSNEVFFDDFEIPVEDLIGEEGSGFEYILEGMNPERVLVAAEAVGLGMLAVRRAARYANERIVFDRPIGKNQSIQHPLAKCWADLEAAWLMTLSAACQYDAGLPCGAAANAAKYLAGEAGYSACETAVMVHGGFGYAREYHVERYFRESLIPRIAPISPQLALSYLAERELGLPRSY